MSAAPQDEEQRQEGDAPTTATSLQVEEIKLMVKNEVRAEMDECTQGLREQLETLEKLMRMFSRDAADERERREAEAEERLREEQEEAAAAAKRAKKKQGDGDSGSRTERGGGTSEIARLMKSLLRGGAAGDGDFSDSAEDEEAEEDEQRGGAEKSKESVRKSKGGGGGTREEIRALLQNGGISVPNTFGKLDDAELALKAAAMLENTSFNLDKAMVKGAQRGRFGYEDNGVVIEHLASISSEKMCITSGSLEHDEVVLAQTEGGRDVVMKTKESKAPTTLVESGYDLSDRIRNLVTIP